MHAHFLLLYTYIYNGHFIPALHYFQKYQVQVEPKDF